MKKYMKIFVIAGLLVASMMSGCSDRGTNAPYKAPGGAWGLIPDKHVFSPQFRFQIKNPTELMNYAVYLPQAAVGSVTVPAQRVPLLVLLAPEGGDQFYYFDHGLFQLAEQMIADGVIQPMVIACIGSDQVFGGYFYGNSLPAGLYDSVIGSDLIRHLNNTYGAIIDDSAKRGIGGVGQGAYGAFRAVLQRPGSYNSISVTDGPLDFDGATGSGGFIPYFAGAVAEQNIPASMPQDSFNYYFDSSATHTLSRMFIGGSLAFSPHDTAIIYRDSLLPNNGGHKFTFTQRFQLADSVTWIKRVINGTTTPVLDFTGFDFHLPFTKDGAVYPPIWSMWMHNNLDSLLANGGGHQLDRIHIWMRTSPDAHLGYHEQTTSWIQTLTGMNIPRTDRHWWDVAEYSGYAGNPATKDQYLYDLMKQMLVFHSNAFGH
jgi:hypothetical protein